MAGTAGWTTGPLSSSQFPRGNTRVVIAEAPLSEMFGYATSMRSMSQGRASYSMEPLTYRPMPENIASKVLEGVG